MELVKETLENQNKEVRSYTQRQLKTVVPTPKGRRWVPGTSPWAREAPHIEVGSVR